MSFIISFFSTKWGKEDCFASETPVMERCPILSTRNALRYQRRHKWRLKGKNLVGLVVNLAFWWKVLDNLYVLRIPTLSTVHHLEWLPTAQSCARRCVLCWQSHKQLLRWCEWCSWPVQLSVQFLNMINCSLCLFSSDKSHATASKASSAELRAARGVYKNLPQLNKRVTTCSNKDLVVKERAQRRHLPNFASFLLPYKVKGEGVPSIIPWH